MKAILKITRSKVRDVPIEVGDWVKCIKTTREANGINWEHESKIEIGDILKVELIANGVREYEGKWMYFEGKPYSARMSNYVLYAPKDIMDAPSRQ